ncbi:DUF3511 domain protein [Rhynchospora pubera]|uniref:DUF3511 domain protein n=1 Tax=Rhynchospora pubera TaxID=906938 RepID=A0AAV8HZL9_9POAL|nr:DUF3511 domain protein [Rhynchospora pubera]
MEHRSKSYAENHSQIEVYNRSSSISCAWPPNQNEPDIQNGKEARHLKRGSSLKVFTDPDFQRKRRVASYKAIGYHGKVKGSFKDNFKWVKEKCIQVVNGWW